MVAEALRRQLPGTVAHLSATELHAIVTIVIVTLELERAQAKTES